MKMILLLGPPGSGKGTVANWLVKEHGYIHLSTGQIFRNLAENDSVVARKIKEILAHGQLVPNDLTNQLVYEHLLKLNNQDVNVVLDGYPRTIEQAEFLQKYFQLDKVLVLQANKNLILSRLTNRLVCKLADHPYHLLNNRPKVPGICDFDQSPLYQRKDDQEDVILKRLNVYETLTAPLIVFYQKLNLVNFLAEAEHFNATKVEIINLLKLEKLNSN